MAKGMNMVLFKGNLGKPAEFKSFNGKDVAFFSIAVTKNWKDQAGEWQNETMWIKVSAWDWVGKDMKDAQPGDGIFVQGKLQIKEYEAKDGTKKQDISVVADTLEIIPKKDKDESKPAPKKTSTKKSEDDDIPF
jgi:single-strand DNA-binding protein